MPADRADSLRQDALRRAQVWRPPPVAIPRADLRNNPPAGAGFPAESELSCRFHLKSSSGRTPKFQCVFPGGEVIKVKYGRANRETRAEVAGSRLLLALGFGADQMSVVRRVRCFGCPRYPYPRLVWLDSLLVDYGRYTDFDFAVLEHPFEGKAIQTDHEEGWPWLELDEVDPALGEAGPAQRDAFRLLAAFLNHWDNKAENQRLVCLPGGDVKGDGSCSRPFAFVDDLGATFGPRGADLEGWKGHGVWADPRTCLVSMKTLPYGGATFPERRISEGGRRFLADLLGQLQPQQVRDLFVGARFTEPLLGPPGSGDIAGWVAAFQDKVRQVVERAPCPAS